MLLLTVSADYIQAALFAQYHHLCLTDFILSSFTKIRVKSFQDESHKRRMLPWYLQEAEGKILLFLACFLY